LVALCAGQLSASGSALQATAHCDRALVPGRVLCEVSAKASSGRLVWSDVLVVRAPAFARPLRSRVLASLGSSPETATAKLALVVAQVGPGQVELLVRGVICKENNRAEACQAVTEPLSAVWEVGPKR
jgi:hypothetical protein